MSNCPRCLALTNDDFAYCAVCSRPRVVESLRAPFISPNWLLPLQKIVLVALSLWLVVTLGIAFLREAKAVRDARQLLANNQAQGAWALLSPFLRENPQHKQGLSVGGEAAVRIGLMDDAKKCLETLTKLSPELGKQLGDDYRNVLTQQAQKVGCDGGAFSHLLESSRVLGDSFPASVTAGLDGFVEVCRKSQNDWVPLQVSSQLAKQGTEIDLVGKGYVPAIGKALGQARYNDAKILAQYAIQSAPARIETIKTVLDTERAKVAATKKTLDDLCQALKSDPQNYIGGKWCFPAAVPASVRTAKDAWGKPFHYTIFAADPGQACHSGGSLTSYGAAAGFTEKERSSPAGGVACRVISGAESWQLPSSYWQGSSPESDGEGG